jgi:hypothetical protein
MDLEVYGREYPVLGSPLYDNDGAARWAEGG